MFLHNLFLFNLVQVDFIILLKSGCFLLYLVSYHFEDSLIDKVILIIQHVIIHDKICWISGGPMKAIIFLLLLKLFLLIYFAHVLLRPRLIGKVIVIIPHRVVRIITDVVSE